MIEYKDKKILSLDWSDIDENLNLATPHCYADLDADCTLRYTTASGTVMTYPLRQYKGRYYCELSRRTISGVTVRQLALPLFRDDVLIGARSVALGHNGATFRCTNIADAVRAARDAKITKKFKYELWKHNAQFHANDDPDVHMVITNALERTLRQAHPLSMAMRRHLANTAINIGHTYDAVIAFQKKYPLRENLLEISGATLDELIQTVALPKSDTCIGKSATRRLKHTPVSHAEMNQMVSIGYKNPGAFPYEWIRNIPPAQRGDVTAQLHAAMRDAAIKSYCPDQPSACMRMEPAMDELAAKMSEILHLDVDITYIAPGHFAKAHQICVAGAKPYILKTYHSNCCYDEVAQWNHDTELQNSFLVGGRKYQGQIRFRKIATAGLSNQRGEIYLVAPMAMGQPKPIPTHPYTRFKWYQLYDTAPNRHGNTIIDCGAIDIHPGFRGKPYMTKIINTVLYRPWDDLSIVLKKYKSKQIRDTVNFMNEYTNSAIPNYNTINAKLVFLDQKTR